MSGEAFTSKYGGVSRKLVNEITVASAYDRSNSRKYYGLWDTGASASCISQRIVDDLKLIEISKCVTYGVHGPKTTGLYPIAALLPNNVSTGPIAAALGDFGKQEFDMLIGMDIITHGDFAVTHHKGKTTLSFRTPSMVCIDFVKKTYIEQEVNEIKTGRNDPCPCGSGKKSKHCCGQSKKSDKMVK